MCLVIQPDSVVLQINVDCKANGQDCLAKVCEHLGIVETDYFGLLYVGSKGERFWLNLRNPINQQLPGSAPYRLHLRVKFFVQPHFLLQETTRYQFYLNIKQDFKELRLKCWSATQVASLAALVAQAELGDRCPNSPSQLLQYQRFTREECCDIALLEQKHARLKGMTSSKAQYQLLQEASTLDSYGVEYHEVKDADETGHVGVGPSGIDIYDANWQFIKKMEYPVVQMVTHDGRAVFVHLVGDQGLTLIHSFKLANERAASAFYRCVIEMYSFYRCDTVRQAVASRYSRDLKGTLASLFNENTSLGKKYVFDIQRTAKESYDRARRVLYSLETSVAKPHLPSEGECPDGHREHIVIDDDCEVHDCQKARMQLQTMREALLCRVCMDQNVNTVLCPCGHMACCRQCTLRLDSCPLCRQPIANIQNVFLPDLSCDAS